MRLNEDNFILYAARNYDANKSASIEEFYDDLKRFQYIKRLFRRYHDNREMKTRLILNHLITIYNCFGPNATHMLFLRLEEYHSYLKPFVMFLGYLPDKIYYNDKFINTKNIKLDTVVIEELRKI